MTNFVRVAATSDIPVGQGRTIEVNGKHIAVFNVEGTFHAIDNTCKHRGGPLGEGELEGTTVACPWHGWTYNVTSGECFDDPSCTLDRFAVKIEGDALMVEV